MKTPNPKMNPCKSSQVKAHGHCAATNTLCVEFKSGGTYHYQNFSAQDYEALRKAESVGKYLQSNVKGKFKFAKQEPAK